MSERAERGASTGASTQAGRVPVRLAGRGGVAYDVAIGAGVLSELAGLTRDVRSVLLVRDPGVPGDLVVEAQDTLAASGAVVACHPFGPPRETIKAWPAVEAIARDLAGMGADRSTSLVVALGGGIVGDTAGFAAAAYQRGIPVVQCPTTLLAMVDASVGGKTGVNLTDDRGALLKNYLGAFHQPVAVLADTRALASLDERVFRAGLAECVKHACLSAPYGDAGLLDWTDANADRIGDRDEATLGELIERNVRIKAAVVAGDERERAASGGRALLNLGHTFAHVIEPLPGLSPDGDPAHAPLHHGEAVALGVCAAAEAAARTDPASGGGAGGAGGGTGYADRLRGIIARLGLPTRVDGLPPTAELVAAMTRDKKTRAGRLRVVLPHPDGSCSTLDDPPPQAIGAAWDSLRIPTR